jgi:predicted kinase
VEAASLPARLRRRSRMIVIMAGLPGAGKSTLCRSLAELVAGVVLDKDVIRTALFPPARIEYSAEQDDFCQSLMIQTAGYVLARDPNAVIFFDGRTFSRRYQMEAVIESAEKFASTWRILECRCSEETARQRLEKDQACGRHLAGNRSFDLYLQLKAAFEPILFPKLVIDTDQPLEECVAQARAVILNRQ